MTETSRTPPDAAPAIPGARLTIELRGAVQLVLAGIAVRVELCGLVGRDVVAAMAEVADLADIVPIRTEHDATDVYTVIVGPARADT
jgi:hypothetical protein